MPAYLLLLLANIVQNFLGLCIALTTKIIIDHRTKADIIDFINNVLKIFRVRTYNFMRTFVTKNAHALCVIASIRRP